MKNPDDDAKTTQMDSTRRTMKELGSGAVRWATPAACVNEIITNVLVMKKIGENQFRLIGTRESRLGETIR
jgi:hypothetical protein